MKKRFLFLTLNTLLCLLLLVGCGNKAEDAKESNAAAATEEDTLVVAANPAEGSWVLIELTYNGVTARKEELAEIGSTTTLELLADGTGTMNSDGEVYEITWDEASIISDGIATPYTLSEDGLLTLSEEGTRMTFARPESNAGGAISSLFGKNDAVQEQAEPSFEESYTIKPAAAALGTQNYTCSDFSMEIPNGWTVEAAQTAAGMYHAIKVYDPAQPVNQIFYILKAEPIFPSEEIRSLYTMSNQAFAAFPVLSEPSTEGLFKVFSVYASAAEAESFYSTIRLPRIQDFTVTETFESNSSMKAQAVSPALLRADFTQDGVAGEGMFTADVIPFGIETGGYYMAYGICGVTAAKDSFQDWESVLSRCLGSLDYSQSFVNAAMAQSDQKVATSQNLSRIANETADGIMSSWENRNRSSDIMSQKQSDATLGYERVTDTETGEIYKADNGFLDVYDGTRYQAITDDQYTEAISGYIEKID